MATTGRRVSGTPGTGAINFSDFVQANRGAASALANRLAGDVETQGRNAASDVNNLYSDFGDLVSGGTLRFDDGPLTHAQALAMGGSGYTGPNALSDMANYNSAMGAAQTASDNARGIGDLYGRGVALQDTYGKDGTYTSGQRLMDSALAGAAGGSRFAQLGQQWGGLFGSAQGREQGASTSARDARDASETARQQYAAAAPALRAKEEDARIAANESYIGRVEREQDENERRGGVAGSEGGGKRRNRSYGTLEDWGKGGAWG